AVVRMLDDMQDVLGWRPPEESTWRIWLERPFRYRVEEHRRAGAPGDVNGGDARNRWQLAELERRVYRSRSPITDSVARIGPPPATLDDLAALDADAPLFHAYLHPIIGELLDPNELFRRRHPGSPEHTPLLHEVERTRLVGREALRVRAIVPDWDTRKPIESENLWVADDYDVVFD